jgi:hypothetical protein
MHRKIIKKFLLISFLTATLLTCSSSHGFIAFGAGNVWDVIDSGQWQIVTDSGWPGASRGAVNKPKDSALPVELKYTFKSTKSWPWPEIDFWINFKKKQDLGCYAGIKLILSTDCKGEIYVCFMAEDKNLSIPKPLIQRCMLNGKPRQEIYLAFSDFKIAKDWSPRNPGYDKSVEWSRVSRFGIHKKGINNEQGNIVVHNIEFLFSPVKSISMDKQRMVPPRYYSFIPMGLNEECENTVLISGPKGNQVGPYFYGSNWGVWLDLPDKDKTAFLGLKLLRAGGPFMDRFDWRKSKFTFPGNNKEVPMVSLDEFIKYCHSVAAEPLIQINALGRSTTGRIENDSVAELVRYLNKENGYGVRFFEIGNEPFIWHEVHFDLRANPCSVREYFELFKKISLAIKNTQAKIDPDLKIKIFAPAIETSWLEWGSLSNEDGGKPVLGEFLKMCKEFEADKTANPKGIRLIDVLSFHLFPSFKETNATKKLSEESSSILGSTQTWWNREYTNKFDVSLPIGKPAAVIPKLKEIINENYPGLGLAVTEFNIESGSMVEYDPLIKVLYLADLYGIMAKSGIDYSVQFCLNSSDQNIALIDDLDNITPFYYVVALYAKYFNGVTLNVTNSLSERLNVYACNNKGDTVIMAVNKDTVTHQAKFLFEGKDKKESGFLHSFPPLSITCIKINRNDLKQAAECWEYGKQQIN